MKSELQLAKINKAYHRKQMEYFQEEIKILRSLRMKKINKEGRKALSKLRSRNT